MLRFIDGDPVQIICRFGEWSLAEAHVASHTRFIITLFLEHISRIATVFAELQPLVDQLERRRHLLRREIPRILQDSEDATAIGRHHRPDDRLHRRDAGWVKREASGRTVPIYVWGGRARRARLPLPLRSASGANAP